MLRAVQEMYELWPIIIKSIQGSTLGETLHLAPTNPTATPNIYSNITLNTTSIKSPMEPSIGLRIRLSCPGFRAQDLMVQGLWFSCQGLRFGVHGLWSTCRGSEPKQQKDHLEAAHMFSQPKES